MADVRAEDHPALTLRPGDRVRNIHSRETGTVAYANRREVMVKRDYGALVSDRAEALELAVKPGSD